VNTALVGIGALNPSSLLAASGNAAFEKDIRILRVMALWVTSCCVF
jgi:hypothetical protein